MVTVGLFVSIKALAGKEAEVEAFLKSGLALVDEEPDTVAWFAIRFDESTFGIFDAFPGDEGRDAHLNGKVAEALMAGVGEIIEQPTIQQADVLAAKLP